MNEKIQNPETQLRLKAFQHKKGIKKLHLKIQQQLIFNLVYHPQLIKSLITSYDIIQKGQQLHIQKLQNKSSIFYFFDFITQL
ncbi:unnamed protein product [Paramecium pentaurelia]|uniref:Uncharacterized protein n=1 Tax=Paramecium pentaurelia TaxID=43138 RepID=A0A8S1YF01_9CILI|nr:unnamed protein product [Paramecium pentaurelia]CAD8210424.1 unnamed protein product [Paramecium pentaurelia]